MPAAGLRRAVGRVTFAPPSPTRPVPIPARMPSQTAAPDKLPWGAPALPPALHPDTPWTWPNLITATRLVAGLVLFTLAALQGDERLNLAGLAVYWALDILDGAVARWLNQETLFGGQFDILADRLLVAFFYLNELYLYPSLAVPVVLFLVQFMGVDHFLSNQYLRHPGIVSPNYYYLVDRKVWQLNWSPAGKAFNTGLVTLLLVLTRSPVLVSAVVVAILIVKFYSVALVLRTHPVTPSPS